jgi:hypothetical protein
VSTTVAREFVGGPLDGQIWALELGAPLPRFSPRAAFAHEGSMKSDGYAGHYESCLYVAPGASQFRRGELVWVWVPDA